MKLKIFNEENLLCMEIERFINDQDDDISLTGNIICLDIINL